MQDFESVALGLIPGAQRKTAVREHVKFSEAELVQIARAQSGDPMYLVLLRLFEGELEKLETDHLKHWKDKEMFDRTGIVAVAARTFYERIQREVNYQAEEYQANRMAVQQEQEAEEMTPEDIVRRGFGMDK